MKTILHIFKATLGLCMLMMIFSLGACIEDPIEIPFQEAPDTDKVVLIEEVTGINCVNCPNAARQVKSIQAEFGKNVLTVAYHSNGTGTFGKLFDDSDFDFRTEETTEIVSYIDFLTGVPCGAINRIPVENSEIYNLSIDKWRGFVLTELDKDVQVLLTEDFNYNRATRELDVTLNVIPAMDINEPLLLTAMITESHIIDSQLDSDGLNSEYEHNHVCRKFISPVTGKDIGNEFIAGETYSETFSITLPEENVWWVADNCEVLWFVHKGGDSKEILQSELFHFTEE